MSKRIGYVTVIRRAYRVRSDGIESWDTKGVTRRRRLILTREDDESVFECVIRTLAGTWHAEDFGTLDSYSGLPWGTFPFRDFEVREESEARYGEAYIEHWIDFDGPVLESLPELVRQFRECGMSW